MLMRRVALYSALLMFFPGACIAGKALRAVISADTVTVTAGSQSVVLSLPDAAITLKTLFGTYRFAAQIKQGDGWTAPSRATSAPQVSESRSSVNVTITFAVEENRQLELALSAHSGVDAVFITSRLRNLGSSRAEYYFWAWDATFDHYFEAGESGPVRKSVDTGAWSRFGYRDWFFLPSDKGGLALITTGSPGRAPGPTGMPFLNALPSSRNLGRGESLDVVFGIAGVENARQAEDLWRRSLRRAVGLRQDPAASLPRDLDYGAPAPDWLRNADLYNGFYKARQEWSRQNIRERLCEVPLVVGVPHDRAIIDRCHRAGIRVIPYVNYMELLNTEIEAKAKGSIYYEWLQSVDHESLDLAQHPEWVCVDSSGRDLPSAWGSANGHPGLFHTCLHQQTLREAALGQVRKLMEMGSDGVFIDNAVPLADCFGEKLGKHSHAGSQGSNTDAYESLLREIYKLVKSFGHDKIVMQNSTIIADHWAYCDSQMWEACIFGAGVLGRMQEWSELEYRGRLQSEAVRRGKVPVILSYLGDQPPDARVAAAVFSYAYARLYGFLWADWFTLDKTPADRAVAHELYRVRLGKALGEATAMGAGVMVRRFERGLVALNPTRMTVAITVAVPSASIREVGAERAPIPGSGKLRLEMKPDSARVLVW